MPISSNNNFCPFIQNICRSSCVFKCNNVTLPDGSTSNCLIAIKLASINEMQHNDISAILNEVKKH